MAENCAKLVDSGKGLNVLANRWFQPLTHVSEARTPRETGIRRQAVMREKRGVRGCWWHSPRHNLFKPCSAKQTGRQEASTSQPALTNNAKEPRMANEDVPEMYRGSQKQIDGYRWIRELTRDIDKPLPTPIPHPPRREVVYRPQPAIGTIYFIAPVGGPIKIGFASRLEFRLKDLRTMNPYPLEVLARVEGPPRMEREYHKRFKAHRLHGEWFERHPDILAEIERLSTPGQRTGMML